MNSAVPTTPSTSNSLSLSLPDEVLLQAIAHCEQSYPNEGCGVFIADEHGRVRARPMANAVDRYHARDPDRFPRTARTAYLFNPAEQIQVFDEAERQNEKVTIIFHSHADVGAYFSAEDSANALVEGKPLLPGVDYLVISVRSAKADDLKLFRWNGTEWAGSNVVLPKRS